MLLMNMPDCLYVSRGDGTKGPEDVNATKKLMAEYGNSMPDVYSAGYWKHLPVGQLLQIDLTYQARRHVYAGPDGGACHTCETMILSYDSSADTHHIQFSDGDTFHVKLSTCSSPKGTRVHSWQLREHVDD